MAPLLPKLRGLFAEFLSNASSVDLRILSSSTCVGFRYGYIQLNSGFSWHRPSPLRYFFFAPPCGAGLSIPRLESVTCVPTFKSYVSAGISTCCPSTTPLGLALGPDFPRADQLYPGILGYSVNRILTYFSLLIPAFSLLISPRRIPPYASSL